MRHHEPTVKECLEEFSIIGVHPAADLFPLITGAEFDELVESIGHHGLEDDIELTHDGLLLDGRNRLRACFSSGMPPRITRKPELYANDYVGYVIRKNLHRRMLSSTQRAAVAAEALPLYEAEAKQRQVASGGWRGNQHTTADVAVGQKIDQPPTADTPSQQATQKTEQREPRATDKAAADFGTNRQYVSDAKKIKEEAPEVFEKMKAGEVSMPKAKREVAAKKAIPREYVTLSQWQQEKMDAVPEPVNTSQFNRQSDNAEDSMGNIEWAAWSWNPVTGCKHDCSYCYARDIAQRFYPQGFEPTLHPDRLTAPYNTSVPKDAEANPAKRNVFANSMSDLYGRWVPQEWIDAVFKAMADNPQWNFLTLTKFPKRAAELVYPKNVWIGTSVDLQVRVKPAEEAFSRIECGVKWLSIEPMIEPLQFSNPGLFDWVVIGGASRSSKTPEWTPPAEWIVRVAAQFLDANPSVKIYLKTNGRPREFPGVITAQSADDAFKYLGK
jgi:protein gp37